ncbi:MAG TPA: S8 family serine peptidase, partial [Verrucomicrobiae bacterium]
MKHLFVSRSLAAVAVTVASAVLVQTAIAADATKAATASGPAGKVELVVRLGDSPLATANGANFKKLGGMLSAAQQRAYARALDAKHSALLAQLRTLGGREIARLNKSLNAVIVEIDSSRISAVRGLSGVVSARPVGAYQIDLSETVPYIGAAAAQAAGIDGTGVRVAVLDSGIDYTHRNLGGPGTLEAYEAAYGISPLDPLNKTLNGLFPTAKVIGGYDFVGELWPNGALAPDPDPIDFNGHGTHVADIIAGRSADGLHKGVAPGAKLYAVRVCASLATSCSGVALLEGIDFALDPNGDGDISDAVDVINMSLGSNYGQKEDDLSEASANAVRAGIVVVCSAGNGGNLPYIVGSPSTTPEVISVAQTQVPSALKFPLVVNSPTNIAGLYRNTETVGWAPIGAGFTGDVVFVGRGCPGDAYLNTNVAGKVVLIDRGSCAVSLKVDRAAKAGAIGVILGLVAPGDPISFSFGGGDRFVPTLIITQADANRLKSALTAGSTVNVTVSPALTTPLVKSMVGSSSRGPGFSYNTIKPDIGAPGSSVSAEVGTGNGETAFGGTSGAAPMISGSAALLVQAFPTRSPLEIKSLLMNTAETGIQT